MSIIEAEELQHSRLNVISHSYGSLVFDAMQQIAEQRGWTCFDNAEVVMLAPSGVSRTDNIVKLGWRFLKSNISEMRTNKDFPDLDNEMLKAGTRHFTSNVRRGFREIIELSRRRVGFERLLQSGISGMAIMGYAEDKVFSHKQLEAVANEVMLYRDGVRSMGAEVAKFAYLSPVSLQETADGQLRLGRDASHNDEQFNPARVAGAVDQYLR